MELEARMRRRAHSLLSAGVRPGDSLVHVRCGAGELLPYLHRSVTYVGVDDRADMLAQARRAWPNRVFIELELAGGWDDVPAADWFVGVDMLGLSSADEVRQVLARMWSKARMGVAVSFETRPDPSRPTVPCWSPVEMLETGLELTRYVCLDHRWSAYEAALHLLRQPR